MEAQAQPQKQSHKPSITGGVLAVLALVSAGISHFLTHAESRSTTEVTTPVGTVDSGPVADVASNSITGVLSMPFIVVAITLGLLSLLFTVLRLRKVKTAGLLMTIVFAVLAVWAITIAIGAMDTLKADPA